MRKLSVTFFAAVLCFSISVWAKEINTQNIKVTDDTQSPYTCITTEIGYKICDDGIGSKYTELKSGARYSFTLYFIEMRKHEYTYYFDTSTVLDDPYMKNVVYTEKQLNDKVLFIRKIELNKNIYKQSNLTKFYELNNFKKYSKNTQMLYDLKGNKEEYNYEEKTTVGVIKMAVDKWYFTNGKVKEYRKYTRNNMNKITQADIRLYYSNGKVKDKLLSYRNSSGKKTKETRNLYLNNGTNKVYRILFYKNGKETKMVEYLYNKKGQLKSNKNGNAYKLQYTIKSNLVTKTIKAKYNNKGKLGKYKIVKNKKITTF